MAFRKRETEVTGLTKEVLRIGRRADLLLKVILGVLGITAIVLSVREETKDRVPSKRAVRAGRALAQLLPREAEERQELREEDLTLTEEDSRRQREEKTQP